MDTTVPAIPARAGRREWLSLSVLVLAVLLLAVDGTVLSLAVPSLSESLNPTANQLLWIGDVYSFALAGLLVTMGNLGDRMGRKRLLLIGGAGFGAASVLAAFAPTAGWLIAARALLGVAGATIMPSTLAIIRSLFTDTRQRTTAIAVWAGAATAGAAVGPLVGGALLEQFWWGSVFLLNVPVMAVLLLVGPRVLPESRNPRPGPLDLLSAALSVITIIAAVYAVKTMAGEGPSPGFAVSTVLAVAAGVVFVRRQRRLSEPLFDLALFRLPAFTGAVTANLLSIFALSGLGFFLSQYLQFVLGLSPLDAGLRQLPMTVAAGLTSFVVGAVAARFGPARTIGGGLTVAAAGSVLIALAELMPSGGLLAIGLAAVGFGIGHSMTLTTDAIVTAAPPARAGAASAVSETAYELGVALGIALLGSLHTVLYRSALHLPGQAGGTPVGEALRESLASGVTAASSAPAAAEAALTAGRDAFADAMVLTSCATAILLLAAGVLAWRLIPNRRQGEHDRD